MEGEENVIGPTNFLDNVNVFIRKFQSQPYRFIYKHLTCV